MKKSDLKKHLENNGCAIERSLSIFPIDIVKNEDNGMVATVYLDSENVNTETLFRLLLHLRIPAPFEYEDEFEVYKLHL